MKSVRSTVLALVLGISDASAQNPIGGEFQITDDQVLFRAGGLSSDASGGFVVVWSRRSNLAGDHHVYGRRFDSSGAARGDRFQVNSPTSFAAWLPTVSMDSQGGFVVVWPRRDSVSNLAKAIQARRYDSAGSPTGPEFEVYDGPFQDTHPVVSVQPDGHFVVVWVSGGAVHGRRFDVAEMAEGPAFPVSDSTSLVSHYPFVSTDAKGDFTVTWQSYSPGGNMDADAKVFGRRFASDGTARGTEFTLRSMTTARQVHARVGTDPDGGFLVAWADGEPVDHGYGLGFQNDVRARLYDSTGEAQATSFLVDAETAGEQYRPAVSPVFGGSFIVVWENTPADYSYKAVRGRLFNGAATPVASGVLTLKEHNDTIPFDPAVARQADVGFVVVWNGSDPYGKRRGLFGARFDLTPQPGPLKSTSTTTRATLLLWMMLAALLALHRARKKN